MPSQAKSHQNENLKIIEKEIGPHSFTPDQFELVKSVVASTADFEYAQSMTFHPIAVAAGMAAIRAGADIVTDTQMVAVGIPKSLLAKTGGSVWCLTSDNDVVEKSRELQLPREVIAMRKAADECKGAIYVVGSSPEALSELIRLVQDGSAKPSLIVGVPVGFHAAFESKEQLLNLSIPFMTCRGRKGGCLVAVAIIETLSSLTVR
ncbi:MAG: precorrin-8X methylmutase [Nitrospiria bacterium]